ncbi:MAG: amidinotransferase [Flavobacteriales bacterium]|nr:amidinotransferase [Flavobacteriales bacterium]
MKPCTNRVFIIEPAAFTFNDEAARSNHFQRPSNLSAEALNQQVKKEFHRLADALKTQGIEVTVFQDTPDPVKPDAVFPNNWISVNNKRIITYPMCHPNRRTERRQDIIDVLMKQTGITTITDLSVYEQSNRFLEGTGSIVFDHPNRLAYACLSDRTHESVLQEVCSILDYQPVVFHAYDVNGLPIYHTNVMMSIAPDFAVICLDSITDELERKRVEQHILKTGKEIVALSQDQVNHFAGNMLTLEGTNDLVQVMSRQAYNSLRAKQLETIRKTTTPLPVDITTIETIGGGSVRCMIAEIFD